MMEKARDISIVKRVSSPLISQAQSMPNASKSIASFHDQRAFNEMLKHHAVSLEETHEKSSNLNDRKINFQCFLRYLLHSVAIRLSVLINVIRILNSFAFDGEVFDDEVFDDEVFDDEVFDGEVFDDEVFDDEVFDDEVFDGEAFVDADNKLLIIEKFRKSSILKI